MRTLGRGTRARLALVFALLTLAVTATAAALFWTANYQFEYSTVDGTLRGQADVVRAIIARSTSDQQLPTLPPGNPRGVGIDSIVINGSGDVVAHDQLDFDSDALVAWARQVGFPPQAQVHTATIRSLNMRILLRVVQFANGGSGGLIVARSIDELEGRLARTTVLLVGGVLGVEILAGLLAWRLAGLALVPVRRISATAREIGERDLHRRLESTLPDDDELGELIGTINAMLGRLEHAFDALQRFTADAAHELRAPLAVMRSQVEVTLRQPRDSIEYQKSHETLLHEIERLSRVADNLLLLARADAGALDATSENCDMADLLEETAARWRIAARSKGVSLDAEIPSLGSIQANGDLVARLLDNLLDNAIRCTPPGGRVSLYAERKKGNWTLAVSDTGPGISVAARPHLFERFYRGDAERNRDSGGAGLGLSLCSAIVHALGGTIAVEDNGDLQGARFVVRLPDSKRDQSDQAHA